MTTVRPTLLTAVSNVVGLYLTTSGALQIENGYAGDGFRPFPVNCRGRYYVVKCVMLVQVSGSPVPFVRDFVVSAYGDLRRSK